MKFVVENMRRAMNRDAVIHERFWFRTGNWRIDKSSNNEGSILGFSDRECVSSPLGSVSFGVRGVG